MAYGSRLPQDAHTGRPWRIHAVAPDFRVEDVWALPCRGGREDFPRLVAMIASRPGSRSSPRAVRALFALRTRLGSLFGWDEPASATPTLRDRLPDDLRAAGAPDLGELPFTALYQLDDEFAAELANRTMHGVLHLGWVADESGGYSGRMAVLVKPNGLLGVVYMAAIRPFRLLIVYPALLRRWERAWARRRRDPIPAGA